jgi:hypothetical protein
MASPFSRLTTTLQQTVSNVRRRSRSSSNPPTPPAPPPRHQPTPPLKYSVQFTTDTLGLRFDRQLYSTRGAYVTGFTRDREQSKSVGGLAREIRVGDNLISCNGVSLLLPSLANIQSTIARQKPCTLVFERQTGEKAGFAAIIRRGSFGIGHFMDFVLSLQNPKKNNNEAITNDQKYNPRVYLSSFIFFVAVLSFRKMSNAMQRRKQAQYIFQTFLSPTGVWFIPSALCSNHLAASVLEILGLVKSKLLTEVPLDLFDEHMCTCAKHLSTLLSSFCKSKPFQCIKEKRPAFQITLEEHVLKSTRGLNYFMCYLLQTKEHAPLCCYLDLQRAASPLALQQKYFIPTAPTPIACVEYSDNHTELSKSLLENIKETTMLRFVHSNICAMLIGPSEEIGDLSNLLDVCHMVGIESHRRPMGKKKAIKKGEEDDDRETKGETKEVVKVDDLLGLMEHPRTLASEHQASVEALVYFEIDSTSGKIQVIQTMLNPDIKNAGSQLPQVAPFFVPHGVDTDLDFQEMIKKNLNKDEETTTAFPGSFAFVLEFPSPGGDVPFWCCSVLVHPSEAAAPSSTDSSGDSSGGSSGGSSLDTSRRVTAGIALFSMSKCQVQLRQRLSLFARNNHLLPTSTARRLSLFENSVKQQTMLLSSCQYNAKEDNDMYFTMMLEVLPPQLIFNLFVCALLERKILLVGNSYTLLTATANSIVQLLKPLGWSHVLIPILPRSMLGTLECPTPFIMGIHSAYAYKKDFPFVLDLCVVNLDDGTITMQQANAEMLDEDDEPDELFKAVTEAILAPASQDELELVQNIQKALKPMSSNSDQIVWLPSLERKNTALVTPTEKIQTLFFQHTKGLLKGAEHCWVPLSDGKKEAVVLFDSVPYISRHPTDVHPLLNALCQTGCFSRYITDTAESAISDL